MSMRNGLVPIKVHRKLWVFEVTNDIVNIHVYLYLILFFYFFVLFCLIVIDLIIWHTGSKETYIHIYMHAYICICMYAYMCTYIHICMCMYIYWYISLVSKFIVFMKKTSYKIVLVLSRPFLSFEKACILLSNPIFLLVKGHLAMVPPLHFSLGLLLIDCTLSDGSMSFCMHLLHRVWR